MISSSQEALTTNYVKFYIDKTAELPLCRTCREENETVSHIVNNVKCWPKRNIKRGMAIYTGIFIGDYVKNMAPQWYEHEPDGVIENERYKILWDFRN